jgi:O-antigen/teichoic acid export membrane protein
MGIIRRQSIYNTLLIYCGVAVGFLNKVVIFQHFLTDEEYGMLGLIVSAMVLGSEISQFGVARLIYRFFPHFKQTAEREGAFTVFVLIYVLAGYGVALVLMLLLRPQMIAFFGDSSPLFTSQFYLLIPAVLAHTLYRVSEAFARSHFLSVLPTLTWEVLVRVWQTAAVLLYAFDYLSFEPFALAYMLGFLVPGLIITGYLIQQGKFKLNWKLSYLSRRVMRLLLRYSLMTSLSYVAYFIVLRVDVFMIGGMISEGAAGAYDFAYYLVILLLIPSKSVNSILLPLLSDHLKHNRLKEVNRLYDQSSTTSLVLAQLIFMLMYINLDAFFVIFPKFVEARSVIFLLGIGNLSTVLVMGLRYIIINSRHYRFDLLSSLALMLVVIGSNYLLIPIMGINGAALATAISLSLYNLTGALFVQQRFGIPSFSWKKAWAVLLFLVTLWLGLQVPALANPWADMVLRSSIMLPLYLGIAFLLRLSPDLNDAAQLGMTKLGLKRQAKNDR